MPPPLLPLLFLLPATLGNLARQPPVTDPQTRNEGQAIGLGSAGQLAALSALQSTAEPPRSGPAPKPEAGASEHRRDHAPKPELTRPGDLVLAVRGDLPIILTAPHGGVIRIPGSPARTADGKNKVTVLDDHTAELALLIGQRITSKLGGKPYLVIAEFSRKHADANRSLDEGVEDDLAKRHYLAFHNAASQSVSEIRSQFGRGLLIDIHGQGREPGAIIRGTRNGLTTRRLLTSFGASALTGPDSIFGVLKGRGYTILPPAGDAALSPAKPSSPPGGAPTTPPGNQPSPQSLSPSPPQPPNPSHLPDGPAKGSGDFDPTELTAPQGGDELPPSLRTQIGRETFFDGGFIVFHYGSQNAAGIDSIQMEFGRARKDDTMKLAQDVGDAIVTFARAYLPLREANKPTDEPGETDSHDASRPEVAPVPTQPAAPAAPSTKPSSTKPPTTKPTSPK